MTAVPSPCTSSEARDTLDCHPVADEAELRAHHRIRHQVFVVEQGLFEGSDVDAHDADDRTVHLLGLVAGTPGGAVRLWPWGDGLWQGDRLAVDRSLRHAGLGRPLVRLAVRTAAERGGRLMTAHVQLQNVRFFQALGWTACGAPEDYVGVPHQNMSIDLR
jgi:putative N-acetyltransferase (TIGR04045 family)